MTKPPPLLRMSGIDKRFPGVHALKGVDFAVYPGEVVALIGENGAGKSTLMKILGGTQRADHGTIDFDGRHAAIRSVADASALGIAFIHQELNNLDNLDVAGNIFLGREPTRFGPLRWIDRPAMNAASSRLLRQLGLGVKPETPLLSLSIAQQQMVEIAKALSLDSRLIIMDEPTSSLTLAETERLLETVRGLADQGVSVVYISHRLSEIEQIADRVVALRDGANAGELTGDAIAHESMVRLMVGRELADMYTPSRIPPGGARLEVRGLRTSSHPDRAVDLSVRSGEILGMAGLVGAGRSELAEAIFGVTPALAGEVFLDGAPLRVRRPADAIDAGVYLVPEDRRRTGLVTAMSVGENLTLPGLRRWSVRGLVRRGAEAQVARRQVEALRIKTASLSTLAATLSGGNQQKIVLGKWLALEPKVLIVDEPTRGIDVGARAEIYRLLRNLADAGVAIVMISSDMEEVLGVSDRVAVMHEGAIVGLLDRDELNERAVMRLAVGQGCDAVRSPDRDGRALTHKEEH